MRTEIHPKYHECNIQCACGAEYATKSTKPSYKVAVCAACHPAYTGDSSRMNLQAGQIEKFNRRYKR